MLTKHFINTAARDNFSTHCIKQMGRGGERRTRTHCSVMRANVLIPTAPVTPCD